MSFYVCMRIIEALLMLLLSVICFGFLYLTLAGFVALLACGLYLYLAFEGAQNE